MNDHLTDNSWFRASRAAWLWCWLLALGSTPLAHAQPAADRGMPKAAANYLAQIKPLLRERCFACHGSLKQEGGLRLDTVARAIHGGESGPALMVGDAKNSRLLQRVSQRDPAERMPPEHEGEPLTAEQITLLRDWILAGAPHPQDEQPEADPREHWAFRPLTRPPVPEVPRREWLQNPIDAFVAAQHERRGLTPLPEAPRPVLLRRLSFDLIGLPPTAAEIAAFESDQSPGWYERAVQRLLDDPRHGERWARHWMDIWRYSDWWGLGEQLRNSQKHIWHWRDWIVESLNEDTPYDEMVRLMLAADELHPTDLERLRATGFLARNYFLFNRHQWMDETVEHVSKAFLGLTMNCVRCHDHKYDPFVQVDYYRLRAFFEPYHARLDVLPGEADLEKNGLPRVFDAWPDDPTYRFVRGDEKNPDKSQTIPPGIPDLLAQEGWEIRPVDLPVEAWQPQRRPWVIDSHLTAARQKIVEAEQALTAANQKLAAAQAAPEKPAEQAEAVRKDLEAAQAEQKVAAAFATLARTELTAIEQRAQAWHAIWNKAGEAEQRTTREAAIRGERQLAVAKAQHGLATAQRVLLRAAKDKQAAAEKGVQAAQEALDKATATLATAVQPTDPLPEFSGAQWTATRFFSSTKDDPQPTFAPRSTGRRSALARWITDRRNPLTARVAVNHLWNRHFGTPLVATTFDFGRKGQPPTHPELLDWLACELIDSGWSMKHLHRLLVQSATYRLSSSLSDAESNLARDVDNTGLWRRTPGRLESQAVRDALLALAGSLDTTRGGPSIPQAQQANSLRRSLYFYHSNNDRNLFLTTFDEALVTDCYRREQSIVPQQALAMTNSRLVLDWSLPIAKRLAEDAGLDSDTDFIHQAFRVLLAATPAEQELAACQRACESWRKLPEAGQAQAATEFARANLVWVLLNHHDFITIR